MKLCSVVGARPQFVKAFPVSRALAADHDEVLVHTGQHYDETMSAVFFTDLDIPEPAYNLGVGSAPHAIQTGEMMAKLDAVFDEEQPDAVLVYGDTNSTLAAALVAAKRDCVLAHVEAGLRSFNREMPEEVNRVLTDHAADLLFAPTDTAVANLEREGITAGVHLTGDVMYDAILAVADRAMAESTVLDRFSLTDGEYILATVHRPANTDDPETLRGIVEALGDAPLPVVFPAHPRTVARLESFGLLDTAHNNLKLVSPVGYRDLVRLLAGAERVATDSGGIQKEAFFLDTPCVTLREETEWMETVDAGRNVLVGSSPDAIREGLTRAFALSEKPAPYGDGHAAEKICEVLTHEVPRLQNQ
ncbi:non-hydrolyzing UDP-N-acetylglucosamine 2-epimerase [Haladaptatus sp. DYSN1]|uniref:non-hydrolyzing UDP-N-acetylglucosamine 2-epimerase n=1 Tax=unclassified Haladaptatus TaxID=2622732 RepID=UPI002405AB47|nr:UDP-N-acetylglucosamine 2-epimerase (non-hydrolyzing) [Haladaptatus sp. DYSN1]